MGDYGLKLWENDATLSRIILKYPLWIKTPLKDQFLRVLGYRGQLYIPWVPGPFKGYGKPKCNDFYIFQTFWGPRARAQKILVKIKHYGLWDKSACCGSIRLVKLV